MKFIFILFLFFTTLLQAKTLEHFDEVRVYKSYHRMDMLFQGKIVKTYKIMLGKGGRSPKEKEGDSKVPEGKYTLDEKNPYSKFYRSIHINYPNSEDIERAEKAGVNPGKDVFLHGMPDDFNKITDWLRKHHLERYGENVIRRVLTLFDWTSGCIAVRDRDIQEIFDHFEGPTPIIIYH